MTCWRTCSTASWRTCSIVLLALSCARAQQYCYTDDTNVYRGYSTKTPYRDIAGGDAVTLETSYDAGCGASHLWLLVRHGSRFPGDDDIRSMNSLLPALIRSADFDQALALGAICLDDVVALRTWQPWINVTYEKMLAAEGQREMQRIADSFQRSFSDLLQSSYDSASVEIRHSASQRTAASARAFAQQLFDNSHDVMYVTLPKEQDALLKYYSTCQRYVQDVDEMPVVESDRFEAGPEMTEVFRYIEYRLQLPLNTIHIENVHVMWSACVYEYGLQGDSAWCSLFPENVTRIMEYYEDLQSYWLDGYGHDINYQQACVLLNDVLTLFTSVSPKNVALRFGHSANINQFLALLQLFKDDQPLRADSHPAARTNRKWRTSLHSPMASNIAFVMNNCSSDDVIRFSVYVNEMRMSDVFSFCNGTECVLSRSKVDELMCDLEQVCAVAGDAVRVLSRSSILMMALCLMLRVRAL